MHYTHYKRPLLWVLIVYICCLIFFYSPQPAKQDISHHISASEVTLTAKVVGFPSLKQKSDNVILQAFALNGQPVQGYVYARFAQGAPLWKETVKVQGVLQKPYRISLLGNFDWAQYLAGKNVFSEIKVSSYQVIQKPAFVYRKIYQFRQDVLDVFGKSFSTDLSAIASGVLLGEKTQMDPTLYAAFQDSGAIHLLVASGGNVAFVTLMVFLFCGWLGLNRRRTVFFSLLIAGFYTLAAGADAPLTRAYFMSVCAVLGYLFHRNSGVFQGIILSCLIILIINPVSLFETSFQMSFLATLGIVMCLSSYEISYKWPRWVQFFAQLFLATFSAQLTLLPVFTNVFYKVSWIGLLANMILVPFASFLMALCFLFYLFSCLHIGWMLKPLAGFLLWIFKNLVLFFGQNTFSSMTVPSWRAGTVAVYYAGLFLLFHVPQKEFIKKIYKPVLLAMAGVFFLQGVFFSGSKMWLLNEWNKNSILLLNSGGKRILIGAEIEAEKIAKAVLKSGGKRLDAVLINQNIHNQLKEVESLKQYIAVERVIVPFRDIWPQEEIALADLKIKAEWGILSNRQNNLWQNRGYSGGRDSVSYQISSKDFSFTTAGNGRFVLQGNRRTENIRNGTKEMAF